MLGWIRIVPIVIAILLGFLVPHSASDRAPGERAPAVAREALVDANWRQAITSHLGREEYHATAEAGVIQAPNRAQNLRTHFRERGIEVVPREGEDAGPAWRFGWEAAHFGRPRALQAVGAASPAPHGSRVTYHRPDFDEWYDNTPQGLEQGFTVHAPPPGEGPLCLAGRLAGSLHAELSAEAGAVELFDERGAQVLRYAELHVWDAGGNELASRLDLDGTELAILVEDEGAAYPLTIDPLLSSPVWIGEPNQDEASYGAAVATAGDVNGDGFSDIIVGAPFFDNGQENEGRAWLYLGSTSGPANSPAWTSEANQADAGWGISVGTAGDVNGDGFSDVIVGSVYYDNDQVDEGRAMVFLGSAAGLAAAAAWTVESNQASAQLGQVATAGDVNGDGFSDVIVGAPSYDNGTGVGRAFAYLGSAGGLSTTASWIAETNQPSIFGFSVGSAGDVNGDGFSDVVVGAFFYQNGQAQEGRAFVYHGSAGGLQASTAWTAESNQVSARFAYSVGTAGDVNGDGFSDVIVGAPLYDNGQSDEGRAYVYLGSGTGLQASAAWTAESNQLAAELGYSVSTAGDPNGDGYADVLAGAHLYNGAKPDVGRVFLYEGSATGLSNSIAWFGESNTFGSDYGGAVAPAGDVNGDGYSDVLVGARYFTNVQFQEGRAFVYLGSAGVPATTEAWSMEGNQDLAWFGISVASAGDVNGDGFSDVIVGANQYDNGHAEEGRAFVYHGSAAGLSTTAAWTAESNQINASFGRSVATAGDVNGDGYSDVIVGALTYDNGQTDEGRVFVYLGSPTGLATTAAWTAEPNQAEVSFGFSAATAGDVNGDGFSDVIVGGSRFDNGQVDEGRAYVYHGSAVGLSTTAAWIVESNQAGAQFGNAVATAGDVNGDGFSDVIVGGLFYDNGQDDEGRAFVYMGSASGLLPTAAWTVESNQADALFGRSVATAGDVDGDRYSDVIVGADRYNNGQFEEGRAYVYMGSAAGLSTIAFWSAEGDEFQAGFGNSVGTAGDVNGDGISDVIVGAFGYDNDQAIEGRSFVYLGSSGGLSAIANWTGEDHQANARFGFSVATAGDVNGDGFSDVIAGAFLWDFDEGKAFVHYGNGGSGRTTQLRQQRTAGPTPIAHLGRSDSGTQFRIRAILPSIYGRTRLRMEHEVKPLATRFNGQNTVAGAFVDIGNDGAVEINQLVSALSPNTPYHWRVRTKYDLAKTPFQKNGPWMHVPVNGWNEADLRTADATAGIETAEAPGARLLLETPRPNPFGASAEIVYTLSRSGRVRLAIYDVTGRERVVLADAMQTAGRQVATWDGRGERGAALPAGVYFVRLAFDGHVETQKLVLAR
jgi:hypothetical protein